MKNVRSLKKLTLALVMAGTVVSLTVMAGRPEKIGPHGGRPSFTVLLEKFDADNDNALSKDEVPVPVWNHLSAIDLDKDGSVTETEFNEAAPEIGSHGGRPSFAVLLEKFDADNDNALSKDEVPAPVWNHLSAIDLDKDGSVTETEFNEFTVEK
jgi:uncharacterized cupredoxin-like copper-binding protein